MAVFALVQPAFAESECKKHDRLHVVFERVWMPRLCKLAPTYLYNPPDCKDDSWREWLWLYFYLDGKTPEDALMAEQKHDYDRRTKSK